MENYFVPLLLRGFVLCLLTALALLLLRRTAAAHRHLVCVLALLVLPLLPWAQRLMPNLRLLPPQRASAPAQDLALQKEANRFSDLHGKSERPAAQDLPQAPMSGTEPSSLLPAGSGVAGPGVVTLSPTLNQDPLRKMTPLLLMLWRLGVAILFLRLLVALFRLHRLELQSREAVVCNAPIRISEQIRTPLTWGIRRSVILLPAALLVGDPAACDSALRHEQAHIARWDWIWNLLAELVCMFCWFQPGVWWLRSRMRLESERACDDRVLLSGVDGPDYAAHLLEIVRSVRSRERTERSNEIAPAMAQSREMEKRMRHILDGTKPRHAQTKWLTISAPFALALLSLAALRVSARPQEAKLPADRGAATMKPDLPASGQVKPAGLAEKSGKSGGQQDNGSPAATPVDVAPAITLAHVTWGQTVDGLQPGLLPTAPNLPNNRRVSLNTLVSYKLLVRNVTNRERSFEFQCTRYGPWSSTPYFIPNDDLKSALGSGSIPEQFRALGVSDLAAGSPAYTVKLAPGEAVVVPEEFALFLGDADKNSFPRVESIKAGMNWIVQPITIRSLTPAEKALFEQMSKPPYPSKPEVTIVDRGGKARQVSAPGVGAAAAGKQLYAGIQLEVGTNRDRTLLTHSEAVSAEVFSPDSKRLVTGSADGTATVWDAPAGRKLFLLKGRTAAISSIRYTPDGKFLLTGCTDGAIYIWNATTGESLRSLAGPGVAPGRGVCVLDVSSDGETVLSGYENGTVEIWNRSTGQALGTFTYASPDTNRLLSAAIAPDGKTIAAGYSDATLKVWDLPTRRSLISEKISGSEGITGVCFNTQGYLYTWDRQEQEDTEDTLSGKIKVAVMTVWGVRPRRMLDQVTLRVPPGAINHVVNYDNLAMLFGLSDGRVVLNNMQDGPVTLDAHEGPVAAMAISPDGTLGATGGVRNGKGEAKIWDMQAHKPVKQAQ